MLIVLLGLIILFCKNNKTLNLAIAIWALITVTTLTYKPFINGNNTRTSTQIKKLKPFVNDLDPNEKFYLVINDQNINYQTNKIHTINKDDSLTITYCDTIKNPIVIETYKVNSNLWYFLTLNKKSKTVKTELILKYE